MKENQINLKSDVVYMQNFTSTFALACEITMELRDRKLYIKNRRCRNGNRIIVFIVSPPSLLLDLVELTELGLLLEVTLVSTSREFEDSFLT